MVLSESRFCILSRPNGRLSTVKTGPCADWSHFRGSTSTHSHQRVMECWWFGVPMNRLSRFAQRCLVFHNCTDEGMTRKDRAPGPRYPQCNRCMMSYHGISDDLTGSYETTHDHMSRKWSACPSLAPDNFLLSDCLVVDIYFSSVHTTTMRE